MMVYFRKGKILPQLQHSLVQYFFDCLHVSTPGKATMAQEASGPDFMNFAVSKWRILYECSCVIEVLNKFGKEINARLAKHFISFSRRV